MAKRRRIGKKELADAVWKALPDDQRQLFCTLIILIQALCNDWVFKRELPAQLLKALQQLDPQTLYAVIAECLNLLIDVPVKERLKRVHREREDKKKKRLSAAKKKSRAKKPAPTRRTKTATAPR